MSDTYQTVQAILSNMGVPPEKIKRQARLVTDLDLDSLEMVELATQLEERFAVQVSDEALNGAMTVGDVVETVHRLRGE